ncbi:hypothetical protein H8A95_42375 [Bradyrhizobium sp. Pear76]|uniref:hypothetical protein n=1 Tax=Bradyrhizobium oropedii TaxID=1571201 RepID=UPI001E56A517|nr:hypothetical protein [Bradyrhizobium oropedii]MCC8968747.1 hypothetical protein [Bradyrhizobium oropedii]
MRVLNTPAALLGDRLHNVADGRPGDGWTRATLHGVVFDILVVGAAAAECDGASLEGAWAAIKTKAPLDRIQGRFG